MITYLIRRLLYAIPILLGVNLLTFALFFGVNSPDDMARMQLGEKRLSPEAIQSWKQERGYDQPLFYNAKASGIAHVTDTLFYEKSLRLFALDFGHSDNGRDIQYDIRQRLWPSLALALPTFVLGLWANLSFAMILAWFRQTRIDFWGVVLCVGLMSISGLFYIIGGQYLFAKVLHWAPISGYQPGLEASHFLILPVIIGVVAGIGSGTRWYRAIYLEEMGKDYVRSARARGLSESVVLFKHVLKNALVPVLTGVVVVIPSLFLGSLIMESFFAIPGLGSYTIDASNAQDFAVVRAMVFLGSLLYILGLLLTDIAYAWVDPRVRLS